MGKSKIAYCKIFPAIGIARVGDSTLVNEDEGWFIGPEYETDERLETFSFKDSEGRIKRQGSKFRLFAFDKDDVPIQEITAADAEITWTVELANKKAAWFNFQGAKAAMYAFRAEEKDIPTEIRNSRHGKLERSADKTKYIPTKDRVDLLEIKGGEKSICGQSINKGVEFHGKFKKTYDVYLGELKTDSNGNLIVLGGHGISDAVTDQGSNIDEDGTEFKTKRWIRNYANNDDWYDDISDGPVNAKVVLTDGTSIEVRAGAWVIVAPPDFAPDVKNIITLYDVMEEVAFQNQELINKTTPEIRSPDEVSFDIDIKPILERMHNQRWINARALKGHGTGKPGDFQKGNDSSDIDKDLSNVGSERGKQIRSKIFSVLREPAYCVIKNEKILDRYVDNPIAVKQASTMYMPPLAGDEGDPIAGNPTTWLSLTDVQHTRFKNWAENNFSNKALTPIDELKHKMDSLTKNVLLNCVGGAFYPGIEMTCLSRDPKLYCEAFRINHDLISAGDISKYMAVPWQADFWECQQHWWPAQRPDDVIPNEEFDAIFNKFNEEVDENYEMVLFQRERWDRGIGIKSRPSTEYLQNRILPLVDKAITTDQYIEFVTTGESSKIKNVKIDSLSAIFKRISGVRDYSELASNPETNGSKLPSPWRIQYVAQEAIDAYSGLYFHLTVLSPDKLFMNSPHILFDSYPHSSDELKNEWSTFRLQNPKEASIILGNYVLEIFEDFKKQIYKILNALVYAKKTVKELRDFLLNNSVEDVETENVYNEILAGSDSYQNLVALEMISNASDYLYTRSTNYSGDMDMVTKWKDLGFVTKQTVAFNDTENTVQTENDRAKYDGETFRDYFYYLMNISEHQDFIPYARKISNDILNSAQVLIDRIGLSDEDHPEAFVEYSKSTYNAKLLHIYEIMRSQAAGAQGFRTERTRKEWITIFHDRAVYNQTDGSWLRFIANAGTTNKVNSLLFEVWSDEIGNGDPALHHGNLYTQFLQSFGIYLPPINSRAYADNDEIDESWFISAVFELAISQHSEEFYPELLGMTLFLEWEVMSLVARIKGMQYMGIDSHFYEMHVGIDNATDGHGAKAKEAIEIYLDTAQKEGGDHAVQEEWKRIWRGFVAFATAGYDYFGNGNDLDLKRKHKENPEAGIKELIKRKAKYGSLNHLDKTMGGHRINDLFDEPDMFVKQLENSTYITPGRPDESKLINHLTTFEGPMYKVFDPNDIEMWRDWITWLGQEGDTDAKKQYLSKAESMFILLNELRSLAENAHGHKMYKLEKPVDKTNGTEAPKLTIADFFSGDLKELMKALSQKDNGWVVPFDPASSPIVIDFAKPSRPMGAALDRRFKKLGNQIGRVVLIKWIEAGCPLIDEEPKAKNPAPDQVWNGKQLLVQQFGIGAVH